MYKEVFDKINLYVNERKLTEKEKVELLSIFSHKEKFKRLIKKGYVLSGALEFLRKKLKMKRSEKWDRINKEVVNDITRDFQVKYNSNPRIRLEDTRHNIVLELYNPKMNVIELIEGMASMYYEIVIINQYNVSTEKIKDKIIIDGGANLGEFAIYCARLGAKKVYAFEPVTGTYDLLKKQIELNKLQDKIIPVKMALGDKNETTKICFGSVGDSGAKIGSDENRKESEIIEVIKLDDFVKKNEKIGFIKLDIEGYEENCFKGAFKTIQKDKPILAFSAYHKPTDKTRLPTIIKSIRPDYKIRLFERGEEVFYCE